MTTRTDSGPAVAAADVIDTAAGLGPDAALQTARRFRSTVVEATQASHEALLYEPVPGLSTADRLRVALHCCEAAEAHQLAAHYRALLVQQPAGDASTPALPAMLTWAGLLTTDPRRGDREAMEAALVSPAPPSPGSMDAGTPAPSPGGASAKSASSGPAPEIRLNGFTNETLGWRSWLSPLDVVQATDLQQAVLDESHPQARASAYYLTLIHQPLMLRHRSAAYNAIMYAPGGAPRAERELAAMVVSVTNGCVYCTSVHAQRFAQLARRHDTVEQVFRNPATAGVDERERAIARFAQAVTLRPHTLAAADVAPLRQLGMSAEQILDVLHAAAIFGWANRLMHNLGEPEHPPAGS
jgi:uncharacterized peroxidase-related enzyme